MAADQLRLYCERVERLNEEERGIKEDKKDVFAEMKSMGFCPKTVRKCIALRAKTKDDRDADDALLETYRNALGLH